MPGNRSIIENPREGRSEQYQLMGQEAGRTTLVPAAPQPDGSCISREHRWGVILAGGDGARLQKLTRLICGDDRPKQFCPLVGHDTLLEQTRKRAERSIPGEQTLVSLKKDHRKFYLAEPEIRPSQRVVQPANKGTAPPILHSLLSIEQIDENAVVAILPCDHHYSEDQTFTDALESGFGIAARNPASVVLLGAHPEGPEVEYGWIELGAPACPGSFHVRGFCEKPSIDVARQLIERGSFWNTFVMIGSVRGFLEMIRAAVPDLVESLRRTTLWSGVELHIPEPGYELRSVNFSHDVLCVQTSRLVTLRSGFTGWSDLGHPERAVAVLQAAGMEPWWMKKWLTRKPSASVLPPRSHTAVA